MMNPRLARMLRHLVTGLLALVLAFETVGASAQTAPVPTDTTEGANNTGLYAGMGVLLGGILYLLFRPHHPKPQGHGETPSPQTTSRPPTSGGTTTGGNTTGGDTTTGRAATPPGGGRTEVVNPPCDVNVAAGWYEPTQGVWQDDPSFEDHPGKQLSQYDQAAFPVLNAELKMAVGRATVLFGVDHIAKSVAPHSRRVIQINGLTTCSTAVSVKVRFNLDQHGASQTVYETDVLDTTVELEPPKVAEHPFTLRIPVGDGLPAFNDPKYKPFTFIPGPYSIEARIIRADNNAATALRTVVAGHAVTSLGPTVHFVRATFDKKANLQGQAATSKAEAAAANAQVPDFYPLPPLGFRTTVDPAFIMDADKLVNGYGNYLTTTKEQNLTTAIADQVGAQAFLTGAGRVVISMSDDEFQQFEHPGAGGFTVRGTINAQNGVTLTNKVIVISSPADPWSVGHEVAHTIPPPLWSVAQMKAECTTPGNFHNLNLPLANGVQLYKLSKLAPRTVHNGDMSLMGTNRAMGQGTYIDQCTYRNLIDHFENPPDPAVLLVRGYASRAGGFRGKFNAGYNLDGVADLQTGKRGTWALVPRDAAGGALARYAFDPLWVTADGNMTRDLISFAYRIPWSSSIRAIDLVSPRGVVATERVSANPPRVHVTDLARKGSRLWVRWSATPGTLASVLLTGSDGIWHPYVFETSGSSATLNGVPSGKAAVKVIVTDGSRSTSAIAGTK